MLRKLSTMTEKVTNVLLILLITVLTLSTALQVFTRFVIKAPLVWTEEISRMAFIWTTMLGATLATKHRTHLSVDLLSGKVPKWLEWLFQTLVFGMMTTVALIFVTAGWTFVEKNMTRISETAGIPMLYLYISGPIAGALMLLYLIEQIPDLYKLLQEAFHPSDREGRDQA